MRRYRLLVLLYMLLVPFLSSAKGIWGYIVTNDNDTIKGLVKVPPINLITGGIFLNRLNVEALHNEVRFKADFARKTTVYTPKELKEVGFVHKDVAYTYRMFKVKQNDIVKGKSVYNERMLLLEYNGKYDLYSDYIHIKKDGNYMQGPTEYKFKRLFICPSTQNIGDEIICGNTRFRRVKDYLFYLGFDKLFVDALSKKTNYKHLALILAYYEEWLLEKHPLAKSQFEK